MANVIAGFGRIAASVASLGVVADKTTASVSLLGATVAAQAPAMTSELAGTAAAAADVAKSLSDATGDWKKHQLEMLERLRQMVIPFEGTDAGSKFSWDKQIEDQMNKVRGGADAGDAIRELQRMFSATYDVLQQTFFGSQDPATRAFLVEMQTFINSGVLN